MPQALLGHVRVQLLPFLRCSALFFHFVTEIPGPAALKGKRALAWRFLCVLFKTDQIFDKVPFLKLPYSTEKKILSNFS